MRKFTYVLATLALTIALLPGCQPAEALTIRTLGGRFIDGNWDPVILRGVNRPGLEFRCVSDNVGWRGFITDNDQPTGGGRDPAYAATVVSALDSWPGVNLVRLPLNEACWLGTAPGDYSGAPYRAFVQSLVQQLTDSGRYVILDLHWSAQGTTIPQRQDVAPNQDHSPAFWGTVAGTFKDNRAVMFDLFGEPHIWANGVSDYNAAADLSWACWRDGCTYTYDSVDGTGYPGTLRVAGVQQLIDVIRGTGARNIIVLSGLGWANSTDRFERFRPTDPLPKDQLAFGWHSYPNSGANVNNPAYVNATLDAITSVPIIITEFGEQVCENPTDGFTQKTIDLAAERGLSWTAWGWDRGENCWGPTLVTNNETGAPSAYGSIVRAALGTIPG